MTRIIANALVAAALVAASIAQTAAGADGPTKVERATAAFQTTWTEVFAKSGKTFPVPSVVSYRGSISTPCGRLDAFAIYCIANNSVYYELNTLEDLQRAVGRITGTDGDYAVVTAIGHEIGHAVAYHLAQNSLRARLSESVNTQKTEMVADCLAGAATRTAERRGILDRGDVEEGLTSLRLVGDPELRNAPTLRDAIRRAHERYPRPEQRADAFRSGYSKSAAACGEIAAGLAR